jgi:NAD(P)-dependent dehydrogenase (short-subunit alcohol dehydrogenase family)
MILVDRPGVEPRAGGGLFDLTGRVAVVTGSTRGIGLAIARRLAEHGARVVVSSRTPEACDAAAEDINRAHPGAALPIPCHIGHKDQLQALVDRTISALGQVDVLVANAAVNPWAGPMADLPDAAFDKVLASNVRSNHWLARMVVPSMRAQGGGSIIFISSIGGLIGTDVLGAYAVSKAAEMQLARNLAVEHGSDNIRANTIAPGMVRTDFARLLWEDPATLRRTTERTPLRRIAEPDEIAGAAVFLASPAGAFVTGQTIVVDGGSTIAPTI